MFSPRGDGERPILLINLNGEIRSIICGIKYLQSQRDKLPNAHIHNPLLFLQGLITIHLSVTEQPHWSTASFLPSLGLFFRPHAGEGLTLFFLFFLVQFSLEQNRPPPAASCSRTQHFVPPSPSWWRRAGPPCCHSAASVCLPGSAWGWEEAFEQLCASRSSFLGLQRRPAVKMAKTQLCVMPDRPVAAMSDLDLGEL